MLTHAGKREQAAGAGSHSFRMSSLRIDLAASSRVLSCTLVLPLRVTLVRSFCLRFEAAPVFAMTSLDVRKSLKSNIIFLLHCQLAFSEHMWRVFRGGRPS